jgi:hypothetical protein
MTVHYEVIQQVTRTGKPVFAWRSLDDFAGEERSLLAIAFVLTTRLWCACARSARSWHFCSHTAHKLAAVGLTCTELPIRVILRNNLVAHGKLKSWNIQ